jgi:hypothetical protein
MNEVRKSINNRNNKFSKETEIMKGAKKEKNQIKMLERKNIKHSGKYNQ